VSIVRKTDAAKEPVGLSEMKVYLRIDCNSEDALIEALIKAARQKCENYTERSFITQVWVKTIDCYPRDAKKAPWWDGVKTGAVGNLVPAKSCIELPRGPLQTVVQFKTYDTGDTGTVFGASNYFVDTQSMTGRVCLNNGSTWPTDLRAHNAIEIEYNAGYGDTPGHVPAPIIEAIKMLVAMMYEDRGCADGEMPSTVACLLEAYQVIRL
jgi:hypothetical protein